MLDACFIFVCTWIDHNSNGLPKLSEDGGTESDGSNSPSSAKYGKRIFG